MSELSVVAARGPLIESVHRVSAAVVTAEGRLLAHAGDPDLVTYWRSASKPFQLVPLVAGGGVARFGLDQAMLALACGSHNAEPIHREVGAAWLRAIGATEADLACGGHPSLWSKQAERMIRDGVVPTPLWSNCSGKHAGLLALAMMHGWPTAGYEERTHPVQDLVAETIAAWTGVPVAEQRWGVDGCTAAAVALPLRAMALGYARLGASEDAALATIREAMVARPELVAGTERIDSVLMAAWPGRVLAKIGAEGVFSAALPELRLGLTLKVEDGDLRAAAIALVGLLEALTARFAPGRDWPLDALAPWRRPPIRNTRGAVTGHYALHGELHFA